MTLWVRSDQFTMVAPSDSDRISKTHLSDLNTKCGPNSSAMAERGASGRL
jgi:hypothetical protein